MAKTSSLTRFLEIAGTAATCVWLYSLLTPDETDGPTGGGASFARLDDEVSALPQPAIVAGEINTDYAAGMAGLGAVPGELAVTDEPSAPLKLRRMEVVRVGSGTTTASLRVFTQNTRQQAKRANRDIPEIVRNVVSRYGRVISQAAGLHNVPAAIIATKICIENPDLLARVVTGGGATGIMQIAPGTADSVLRAEYRAGNLSQVEAAFFQAQLGSRFPALLAGRPAHRTADLQNPVYCIHMGTLAFGQMLRKYTNVATGEVQLYKAAAEYNRGQRAEYANARVSSPDELIAFRAPNKLSTPAITQQYIMLYCGPNGPLDYITRNNLLA